MRLRPAYAVSLAAVLLLGIVAGPLLLVDAPSSFLHATRLADGGFGNPNAFSLGDHAVRLALARGVALDPLRDALLILDSNVGYTDAEVQGLRAFVFGGGRLLVAAERGAGAELLDRLDVGVRLTGTALYTPSFDVTPDRVIARSTSVLPGLPAEVILARPRIVEGGTPVLLAPEPSWADTNDNGRPDLDESIVTASVAALTSFGTGLVVVIADSQLFHRADPLVQRAFLDFIGENGERTLVLDEAHRTATDPFGFTPLLAGAPGLLVATGILIITFAIGAFVVLRPRISRVEARRRSVRRPERFDPDLASEVLSELETR